MVRWELASLSGGTFTAATDWGPQFDDTTAAGYMITYLPASQGELHIPSAMPPGLLRSPNLHYWQASIDNAGTVTWTDIGSGLGTAIYASRARIAFTRENPGSIPFTIANPGSPSFSVQLVLNGDIVGEYTSATAGSLSAVRGVNMIQLVAPTGGIVFFASFMSASGDQPGLAMGYPLSGTGGQSGLSLIPVIHGGVGTGM